MIVRTLKYQFVPKNKIKLLIIWSFSTFDCSITFKNIAGDSCLIKKSGFLFRKENGSNGVALFKTHWKIEVVSILTLLFLGFWKLHTKWLHFFIFSKHILLSIFLEIYKVRVPSWMIFFIEPFPPSNINHQSSYHISLSSHVPPRTPARVSALWSCRFTHPRDLFLPPLNYSLQKYIFERSAIWLIF